MYVIDKSSIDAASEKQTKAIDYRRQADKVLLERNHAPAASSVTAQPGKTYQEVMALLDQEESLWPQPR